jgi:hypothetical protein
MRYKLLFYHNNYRDGLARYFEGETTVCKGGNSYG